MVAAVATADLADIRPEAEPLTVVDTTPRHRIVPTAEAAAAHAEVRAAVSTEVAARPAVEAVRTAAVVAHTVAVVDIAKI